MTKCFRIISAFSYRMTRNHSTLFTVAAFFLTLMTVLQLYAHRGNATSQYHGSTQETADGYRPGTFLRGTHPTTNSTPYCKFNYGLPYTINWTLVPTDTTPELGSKSPYRVIYNAIQSTEYANVSRFDAVTYATQATPEFLYHIVEIARFWDGPISLAVFVPDYDMDITIQILVYLCKCYKGMAKVSLHLVYPKYLPPLLLNRSRDKLATADNHTSKYTVSTPPNAVSSTSLVSFRNRSRSEYINTIRKKRAERLMKRLLVKTDKAFDVKFEDCSGPDLSTTMTYRKLHNMMYPINVCRNAARNASSTNYFLVSDIEMVPSDELAPKFVNLLKRLMGDKKRESGCIFSRTVFIIPLFEVEQFEEIPRDKETLVHMIAANRASYFHQKTCPHCQRFPGLQTWLARTPPSALEPVLISKREYPYHRWEPLYFGTNQEPWYSEVLSWEGRQDKMTQMLELCLLQYRMVVLDGGFLCHAAASRAQTRHSVYERRNAHHYASIVGKLKSAYKINPRCKVKNFSIAEWKLTSWHEECILTEIATESKIVQAAQLWNELDPDARKSPSIFTF